MKEIKSFIVVVATLSMISLSGCAGTAPGSCGVSGPASASAQANKEANKVMYKPIVYTNESIQGPEVVVLPGEIKATDATFGKTVTADNIADFGELELGKDNFRVLDRSDLGALLKEVELAADMGSERELRRYMRGKFRTAQWFVKFDVLKAEPVAKVRQGFNGAAAGALLSFIPGVGGAVASEVASSAKTSNTARVWVIGMRYKIIDASTCQQIGSDYLEAKIETGYQGSSFMGVTQTNQQNMTLDDAVQRLVQMCVANIDMKYKSSKPVRVEHRRWRRHRIHLRSHNNT